eukprot:364615-Chlamydomonas_euryale.AAC.19
MRQPPGLSAQRSETARRSASGSLASSRRAPDASPAGGRVRHISCVRALAGCAWRRRWIGTAWASQKNCQNDT